MKFTYPAVFHKTEHGTYEGYFPDLACCYAKGDTLDEALEDAIQLAQKKGVRIVILTGGNSHAIQVRYENLGVEDIFMGCSVKIKTYEEFKQKYSITDEEIIYVGDDIPDYEIMRRCGCPCCPADACSDIKEISTYISACNGGDGVGRDVVEQVLRAKGLWLSDAKAFGW